MKFRARRPDDIDINVTSLIDVVLLLLIFFMVSTRFVEHARIDLTLPGASGESGPRQPAVIEVAIDTHQTVFVDGQALVNRQADTLERALHAAAERHQDPVVVISADRAVDFQTVVDVMDAARHAGLARMTFPITRRERE